MNVVKIVHGFKVWAGVPVPPSQRRTKGGANRELTSKHSLVLIGMPVGTFIEVDSYEDSEAFKNRFGRLATHGGKWLIRKNRDCGGWRIWRTA